MFSMRMQVLLEELWHTYADYDDNHCWVQIVSIIFAKLIQRLLMACYSFKFLYILPVS